MRMDRERAAAAAAAPAAAGAGRSNSPNAPDAVAGDVGGGGRVGGLRGAPPDASDACERRGARVAAAAARGTPGRTRPKSAPPATAEQLGSAPRPISAPPEEPAAAAGTGTGAGGCAGAGTGAGVGCAGGGAWRSRAVARRGAERREAAMSAADAQQHAAADGDDRATSVGRARPRRRGGVTSKLKAFESRDARRRAPPARAHANPRRHRRCAGPRLRTGPRPLPPSARGGGADRDDACGAARQFEGQSRTWMWCTGSRWQRRRTRAAVASTTVKSRPLRSREASPATGRPPEDASAARDEQPAAAACVRPFGATTARSRSSRPRTRRRELRSVLADARRRHRGLLPTRGHAEPPGLASACARRATHRSRVLTIRRKWRPKSERASLYKQLEHEGEMASLVKTSVHRDSEPRSHPHIQRIEPPPRIAPLPRRATRRRPPPSTRSTPPAALPRRGDASDHLLSCGRRRSRRRRRAPRRQRAATVGRRLHRRRRRDARCACASSRPRRRAAGEGRRRPGTAPRSRCGAGASRPGVARAAPPPHRSPSRTKGALLSSKRNWKRSATTPAASRRRSPKRPIRWRARRRRPGLRPVRRRRRRAAIAAPRAST